MSPKKKLACSPLRPPAEKTLPGSDDDIGLPVQLPSQAEDDDHETDHGGDDENHENHGHGKGLQSMPFPSGNLFMVRF